MATRISQDQLSKFISPEAAMAPYKRAQEVKMQQLEAQAAMERQAAGDAAHMERQVTGDSAQMDRTRFDADSRLAQLIRGKEIDEEQDIAKQNRQMEAAQGLRKLLGKDASVRVGDVSMDPRSYDAARFAQGVADKEADNERLETVALQNEFNKLSGKAREQDQALAGIDDLLKDPSSVTEGQLRTALARAAGDVGALSEGDVTRTLPRTLGSDVRGAWNYVTGGTESRLSDAQIQAVKNLVQTKRKEVQGRMAGSGREVQTRASTLAPTLNKGGKLPKVLEGLGVGVASQQQSAVDPKQEQLNKVMQRIQELEAKRNGGAR
jgi:hypothetical protein